MQTINMKRNFLLVVLFFGTVITSLAQQFQGGIAGGLVGSQVAGDTYSGFNKAGVYAGFWIRLGLSERTSLQTEISYFQKGSRHNPDEKRQDMIFYLMRLGYIEMPFLYQLQLKNKIRLEVGPSFSLLLHSHEELDYQVVNYSKFSLINPSFMAGIGYPLTEKISVHFRIDNSLLSIRSEEINGGVYRLFDHGQYNDCILFFVSYKL
jgi:hypothetical protein